MNAVDWVSRKRPMMRKPVAVMGCSVGAVGTRRAQLRLRDTGFLTDDATRDEVRALLVALGE